jgi:hypothetical protein
MRPFYCLVFCLLGYLAVEAQSIRVFGRITDADTKEGIPFCNLFVPGTDQGGATDLDGYYELMLSLPSDSIAVSAVGYDYIARPLSEAEEQEINFSLSSRSQAMEEIVVLAGENPAHRIFRKIVEHKKKNRLDQLEAYQYEKYEKVEIDLENIGPRLQEHKLLKPFAFIFENIDSTSDEKPFLPVFMTERISNVHFLREDGKERESPVAQKVSGIKNRSVVEFIDKIHSPFDIYDDWIYLLEKSFISPFAKGGLSYYEYYLLDSAYVNDLWSYKLKFKPKRKQESTFFGEFWVADSSFAIQHLSMRMSPDVNINLVDRIIIHQEFLASSSGHFIPKKKKLVINFAASKKALAIIGRHTTSYRDFLTRLDEISISNQEKPSSPYYELEDLERPEDFWRSTRHEELSANEQAIYDMVDSIKNVPLYRTYADILYTLFTGYKDLGAVEVGSYFEAYNNNPVEGSRFRLGLITSNSWSKTYQLGAYGAYGLKDEVFKYGFSFKWLMRKNPRIMAGFQYRNDVDFQTQNSEEIGEGNLFSGLFRRSIIQKMVHTEESKLFYERGWNRHLSTRLTLLSHKLDPYGGITDEGGGFNFYYLPDPESPGRIDTTIQTTEIIIGFRYAHNEEFLEGNFDRISLGSKRPIVEFQYAMGLRDFLGGKYRYHKLSFAIRHYFYLNPIGWSSYRLKTGRTFGTLPFLLLEVHPGNETYFYNKAGFNGMNRFEFVSDAYISLLWEHHFEGFFLNKVPLLRKLNWREVVTVKGAIGQMSEQNQLGNQLNRFRPVDEETYTGFRTPERPYLEAGVGIENIFKLLRIDALWRLSYLDNPQAPRFGIRAGIDFYF